MYTSFYKKRIRSEIKKVVSCMRDTTVLVFDDGLLRLTYIKSEQRNLPNDIRDTEYILKPGRDFIVINSFINFIKNSS